jgi:protein-S-isoprenylcysteine O-methyltransferase Ste14
MLKAASIWGYIGMVAGLAGLLVIRAVFSTSLFVITMQVVASLLLAWARATFGRRSFHAAANPTEGGLVRSGPYRYIRHPIYTAVCVFAWAGIAGHWSWRACVCGVLVLVSALVRIFAEEILVAARYPEYAEYAANTWRMIPYVF